MFRHSVKKIYTRDIHSQKLKHWKLKFVIFGSKFAYLENRQQIELEQIHLRTGRGKEIHPFNGNTTPPRAVHCEKSKKKYFQIYSFRC